MAEKKHDTYFPVVCKWDLIRNQVINSKFNSSIEILDNNLAWIIFNPIFLGQSRLNMKCWGWMEGRKWTKWMKLSPKEKTRKLNGDRIHRVFLQQKWKSWNLFLVQKPCLLSITLNNSLFFLFSSSSFGLSLLLLV